MPVKGRQRFFVEEMILPSGRTRQFDVDEVLDRALEVFWARGYEVPPPGADQGDGINRPSLYPPSGIRSSLFRKALDRTKRGQWRSGRGLKEPTARAAAEAIFRALSVATEPREKHAGASSCPGTHGWRRGRDRAPGVGSLRQAI